MPENWSSRRKDAWRPYAALHERGLRLTPLSPDDTPAIIGWNDPAIRRVGVQKLRTHYLEGGRIGLVIPRGWSALDVDRGRPNSQRKYYALATWGSRTRGRFHMIHNTLPPLCSQGAKFELDGMRGEVILGGGLLRIGDRGAKALAKALSLPQPYLYPFPPDVAFVQARQPAPRRQGRGLTELAFVPAGGLPRNWRGNVIPPDYVGEYVSAAIPGSRNEAVFYELYFWGVGHPTRLLDNFDGVCLEQTRLLAQLLPDRWSPTATEGPYSDKEERWTAKSVSSFIQDIKPDPRRYDKQLQSLRRRAGVLLDGMKRSVARSMRDAEILNWLSSGTSIRETAKVMGVKPWAVSRVSQKRNQERRADMGFQHLSPEALHEVAMKGVKARVEQDTGRSARELRDAEILNWLDSGVSYRKTAEVLGVGLGLVSKVAKTRTIERARSARLTIRGGLPPEG